MVLKYSSERREFAGFDSFYAERLAPYLATRERDRAETITNVLILGGAIGALVLALVFFGPFGSGNLNAGIFLSMIGTGVCTWLINRTRTDITHGLLGLIVGRLGYHYTGKLDRPAYCERFLALKLLPAFNIEEWTDAVSGAYSGHGFIACETHLKYKTRGKNSSVRTVFHGQLLIIDYPKTFYGKTILLRDRGVLNAVTRPGKEFSRVGLASPAFEKAFEAWSTDQVEARELLDPIVLERFQELERLFGGNKLRVAFDNQKILLAVETGDRLNIGTMFKPFGGPERIEKILAEFDAIYDLLDVLMKRLDGRIDGAFSVEHVRGARRGAQ